MSSIFVIFSIIAHIVSILLIVILFKRVQLKENESLLNTQKMLETTLDQLKAENDRLRNDLLTETTENERRHQSTNDQIKRQKNIHQSEQFKQLLEKQIEHIADEQQQDEYELTFQGKVLQLFDQGYSKEEIAQRLNRGKTEVDLVLKFHAE